jgi:hypothetical protein
MVERIHINQFIRDYQPFWRGTAFIDATRAFPSPKSLWDLSLEIKSAQLEARIKQLESRNSQLEKRVSKLESLNLQQKIQIIV